MEHKKIAIACEIFTRVSGFYRPVASFNKGKKEEFSERKTLNLPPKEELKKN